MSKKQFKSVFMGTPDYVMPSLEAVNEESNLLAVFTGPDRKGGRGNKIIIPGPKQFAESHNIPFHQPETYKNNPDIIEELKKLEPDFLIVNAYGFILPQAVLDIPKIAPINLHGSLLPQYRGASPIQEALLNGDEETGITAQFMEFKLDSGDILHQVKTKIEEEDDYESLSYRLSLLSASCIRDTIHFYENGEINKVPQDDEKATFCSKIKKEDGLINWSLTTKKIMGKMKAFSHWPQCYSYFNGLKVTFKKLKFHDNSQEAEPGTLCQFDKKGMMIQCGDGTIEVLELQPEKKKAMDFKSFFNGHKWNLGDKFSSRP